MYFPGCTCEDVSQTSIVIIFRGTGKLSCPDENVAYHPDFDEYRQTSACADTECSVNWVNFTLKKSVKDIETFLLFKDNLTTQQTDEFKKSVSDLKGVVWYGLKNATNVWQVVGAGIA